MSDLTVYAECNAGSFKPLHGVNNGPEGYGTLVEVSHYYKELQVPSVRLHDPNWPHAWEIDIHTIFPDFTKDPTDSASYEFSRSDAYIQRIVDTGARVFFRLGESIEQTKRKYYVHPPADYAKWAEICVHIIRHYNEGWANGFSHGIEYWEIWNEPDLGVKMWSGTKEQYNDLYRVTARAIKAAFPGVKVGGPAISNVRSDLAPGFLQMCRDEGLPLDFYSWHTYTDDPETIRANAHYVHDQLQQYGFHQTETIFNEWNYQDIVVPELFAPGGEYLRKDMFSRQKGPVGASFAAAVLTLLQDCPVEMAHYYDGQPSALYCGLFDYYGVPTTTYYAFKAFSQLVQLPTRVLANVDPSLTGLYVLAARQQNELWMLVSNFKSATRSYTIALEASERLSIASCEAYRIDATRNLELDATVRAEASQSLSVLLPMHSVTLLKLTLTEDGSHAGERLA